MKIIIISDTDESDPIVEIQYRLSDFEFKPNRIIDCNLQWEVTNLLPVISIDSHPSFPPKI